MASQAAWIEQEMGEGLAYLDINMGCPARKIVSKGDGSALMKDPALAGSIVRAVKRAVEHPVTVKFRRGWAEGDETAPAFARLMEEAGARRGHGARAVRRAAVPGKCRLGRHRSGAARRCPCPSWATATSAAVPMPWRMAAETGCDAVMIARGAEGNPWLFSQAQAALVGEAEPAPPTVRGTYCHGASPCGACSPHREGQQHRAHAQARHVVYGGTARRRRCPRAASTTARPVADFDARVRRTSGDCPGAFVICPSRTNIAPISCCPSRIRVVRPTLGGIAIRSDSPRWYRRR